MFTTISILQYFNLNQMSVVKANLFNYITKGILSQYNKKGVLYSIVYFLKQLSLAKYNYKIYNKELPAIIKYFKQ